MSSTEKSEAQPLETFDARAFAPDENNPKAVCAFVLTLAVIYNDFKDVLATDSMLESRRPPGLPAETSEWGEYNGFRIYLVRLLAGLVYELLEMIRRNEPVLSERAFTDTVKLVQKKSRDAWAALVAAAFARPSQSELARTLLLARNKVSFHYDCKEIMRGYERKFPLDQPHQPAYISRGATMRHTRFYFADGAAQEYLNYCLQDAAIPKEFGPASALIAQVNLALHEIVSSFIQTRGYPWRTVSRT